MILRNNARVTFSAWWNFRKSGCAIIIFFVSSTVACSRYTQLQFINSGNTCSVSAWQKQCGETQHGRFLLSLSLSFSVSQKHSSTWSSVTLLLTPQSYMLFAIWLEAVMIHKAVLHAHWLWTGGSFKKTIQAFQWGANPVATQHDQWVKGEVEGKGISTNAALWLEMKVLQNVCRCIEHTTLPLTESLWHSAACLTVASRYSAKVAFSAQTASLLTFLSSVTAILQTLRQFYNNNTKQIPDHLTKMQPCSSLPYVIRVILCLHSGEQFSHNRWPGRCQDNILVIACLQQSVIRNTAVVQEQLLLTWTTSWCFYYGHRKPDISNIVPVNVSPKIMFLFVSF